MSTTLSAEARMQRYYAQRAQEYERIYERPNRRSDIAELKAWLPSLFEDRDTLEVACGTGYWTPHAAAHCRSWLATDVNDEVLAVARTKPLPAGRVQFARADAYALDVAPDRSFDAAFAGFWWSHVSRERLAGWLAALHARLRPGARVVFIDNRWVDGDSTPIVRVDAQGNGYQQRLLTDGSRHEVMKNYPTHAEAAAAIGTRARDVQWRELEQFWTLACTLR
jgi:demethylmenaquinone methyltransferase/2-methoxy-6-polyprenyl-1,4-benzoquinol methylase